MGGSCNTLGRDGKTSSGMSLRQDRHRTDGMIILKWNLKEQPVDSHHMTPDTVQLWAVISVAMSLRFPRMTEIFFTGFLVSEEGLCSMELFTSIRIMFLFCWVEYWLLWSLWGEPTPLPIPQKHTCDVRIKLHYSRRRWMANFKLWQSFSPLWYWMGTASVV
jgi:hypothetical protein